MGAILVALEQEAAKGAAARLSNVAARANIAYDRLEEYILELQALRLIEPGRVPRLTRAGREFLHEYRQWNDVLARFGLSEVEGRSGVRLRQAQAPDAAQDSR